MVGIEIGLEAPENGHGKKLTVANQQVLSFQNTGDVPEHLWFAHAYAVLEKFKKAQESLQTQVDGVGPGRLMTMSSTDATCDPEEEDEPPPEEELPPFDPLTEGGEMLGQAGMAVVTIIGHYVAGTATLPLGWNCQIGFTIIRCGYNLPNDPTLPPAPVYSGVPFTWCGTFGLFCQISDEKEERINECVNKWELRQSSCDNRFRMHSADWRKCHENARWEYHACFEKANEGP